jgi:hypothetical protein
MVLYIGVFGISIIVLVSKEVFLDELGFFGISKEFS